MLATGRNAGIYYLASIAHYRRLGVEHFFIYTNDNIDQSETLLDALARSGIATVITNRIEGRTAGQLKVYAHALSWLPQILDYEWTLLIDLDEFVTIQPPRAPDLPSLLAERGQDGATSVSFTWRMFTPGHERHWRAAPLIERFQCYESVSNTAVKTAFVTRLHALSHPHDPQPAPGVRPMHQKPSGALHHWEGRTGMPSNGEPEYDVAWINHYFFKSLDEWIWKNARNRKGFFAVDDAFAVEPRAVLGHCRMAGTDGRPRDESLVPTLPGLEEELTSLRALEGVRAAEETVRRAFVDRVADLRRALRRRIEEDADLTAKEREIIRGALDEGAPAAIDAEAAR